MLLTTNHTVKHSLKSILKFYSHLSKWNKHRFLLLIILQVAYYNSSSKIFNNQRLSENKILLSFNFYTSCICCLIKIYPTQSLVWKHRPILKLITHVIMWFLKRNTSHLHDSLRGYSHVEDYRGDRFPPITLFSYFACW